MLDHLSGGRFEFGFGFGEGVSAPSNFLWGLDPDEATGRTEEMITLLLEAFQSDGDFSFDGDFYRFENVPPLWRPDTLDLAAQLGVSTVVAGPTAVGHDSLARFREQEEQGIGGGHPPTIGVLRKVIVASTDAAADRIGRHSWARYTHILGVLFRRFDVEIPNDPTCGGDYDLAKNAACHRGRLPGACLRPLRRTRLVGAGRIRNRELCVR